MTSYKVNFKRFVRKVLEKDLVLLSKYNETLAATLEPFINPTSIQTFLNNHEKHFRMQFVIELVSSLIHCLKSTTSIVPPQSHPPSLDISALTLSLERQQLAFEDHYGHSLRDLDSMKIHLNALHRDLKLKELDVTDRLRELSFLKTHQL